MKITYRIPTKAPYGYVEIETEKALDGNTIDTAYDAIDDLERIMDRQSGSGLANTYWNTVLDGYINGKPLESDQYYSMSPQQQFVIQELKKAFKRIKNKNGETDIS